jgi:hypothetical protein
MGREVMKIAMKRLIRDEKGAALILALILLLIGGLISAALLNHMGSGILAGEVHERRTAELYAADAGVEDAIWKIQQGEVAACPAQPTEPPYNINVNGKNVTVYIEYDLDTNMYKITSIAITDGNGSGGVAAIDSATAVESYVSFLYMDFSSLLDHAIVSYDTITIQPGNEVWGDVWLPDEEDLTISPPSGGVDEVIYGEVKDGEDVELTWPTAEQLSEYYYDDVEGTYDPGPSIDIKYLNPKTIGPCYREGSLTVDNTGDPDTLVLEGTVYVAGDLEFEQSGDSHNYTVDLNGHTIFAEGGIDFPSNVVGILGPGCIIAVGNINFQPSIAGDDFVLVMSITGQTYFHPSGEFTGCIAGNTEVQLQPGCTITWINPEGKGLDFPGVEGGGEPPPVDVMNIESWEIIQQ